MHPARNSGAHLGNSTADDEAAFATMIDEGWVEQPLPYLNRDGGELAGKQAKGFAPDRCRTRHRQLDLLLQKMVGRFVQLRIMLTGDGRNSPMLRALRIWYPRFSYSERFLPALYREQTEPADFLDRFLANMEGVNSVIEDKIAAAQWLFDTRSASPEMLDWLSDWFDVVLEPSWNDARRRLFLRNATTFFGWRGTIAGMTLALRLAFDESLTDAKFRLWRAAMHRAWDDPDRGEFLDRKADFASIQCIDRCFGGTSDVFLLSSRLGHRKMDRPDFFCGWACRPLAVSHYLPMHPYPRNAGGDAIGIWFPAQGRRAGTQRVAGLSAKRDRLGCFSRFASRNRDSGC